MATAKSVRIGKQVGTDRTLYATWDWSYKTDGAERTDCYAVQWNYSTGQGVSFIGSESTTTAKQSTYNAPSNAISVSFKVRPIAKTKTVNKKTVAYFTATWSKSVTYKFQDLTPAKPSAPTVSINNLKLRASIANYTDTKANRICFNIVYDDKKTYKTVYSGIKTTAAAVSVDVTTGHRYKVRCRAEKYKNVKVTKTVNKKKTQETVQKVLYKSEWTEYTSNESVIPNKPVIVFKEKLNGEDVTRTKALSDTSIDVWWKAVSTATEYTVEYTDTKAYFNTTSEPQSKTVNSGRHCILTSLEPGKTWYFRVKATNSQGDSGWSDIKSVKIGSAPAAPTTWSETTTCLVGETARLYWAHNSEDGSDERGAQIEITINDDTENKHIYKRYTGTSIDGSSTIPTVFPGSGVNSAAVGDLYFNTALFRQYRCTTAGDANTAMWVYEINLGGLVGYCGYDTSSLLEGSTIKWRVKTLGAINTYSPWSTSRTVNVYAPATMSIAILPVVEVDEDGNPTEYGDETETITSYPFVMNGEAGPITQNAVGYIVKVTAQNSYETIDQTGRTIQISSGDEIFSRYYSATSNVLDVMFSAGDIDLANGETYTVSCSVAMDTGLTADDSTDFTVEWEDEEYEPNAEIGLGMADYTAIIQPYCRYIGLEEGDEREGELVENVTLSVYRREYDGRFVEIASKLPNDGATTVTDPHPALDYARYRIVAVSTITGKVSYYDVPGEPFDYLTGIVIQWDEEWQDFNMVMETQDEAAEEDDASYSSSMVVLPYNIDVSDSHAPDVALANYIGRQHPVSYYGTQLGITARWSTEIPADDEETLYALRRLAIYNGDVYVREPSGTGYWAQIKVSLDIRHMALTIPVSFDVTRVDGGI